MLLTQRTPPTTTARSRLRPLLADLALPLSYPAAALLVLLLMVTIGHEYRWFSLGAFAAVVAVLAGLARVQWSPATGGVCWLFYDGFLVNHGAQLAWRHADRLSLGALLLAACAGAATAALWRRLTR